MKPTKADVVAWAVMKWPDVKQYLHKFPQTPYDMTIYGVLVGRFIQACELDLAMRQAIEKALVKHYGRDDANEFREWIGTGLYAGSAGPEQTITTHSRIMGAMRAKSQ